ncbi:MAG: PKD domain-containing protein, partial [Bacteroidetes bacterium]|nr:PKD domain-containing protein [Bacteroidota bacterium]
MDSSKAKLWYAASSNSSDPNYLMILNGAKYFTFKKLGFWRTSPNYVPYAEVIILNNKASNNTITNCWISGPYGYNYQSSCISTTGGKCDNNAFTYNRIKDNYYGINLRATTLSTSDKYNMVKGNDVDSVRQYGLYLYYQDSITVTKNTLKNFQQAYSMGMYCYYLTNNSIITKNKIILTNGGYGLYMFYVIGNGSVTDTCLVANNFISVTAPYSYSCYGIMSYYHDYINFYNNSVLINTTSSGGYGGYFYRYSTANSALVMNNSFVNTSTSGYAIAQSYNGYGISYSDYNNLYSGGSVGLWNGSAQATLADWQSSSSFDANSVSQDPKYFATNDLHTKSPFLDGKGTRVYSVKDDIDGEVRDTLTPDIGADEFFIYKDDIGVTAIIDPNVVTCGDSFTTVTIKITNFGTKKAQGYPISVAVKGASTISQTISDTLYAGADTTITLTSKINTYAGGTYTLKAYTGYSADANHINDTLWQNFKFTPHAANPTTVGFSSCGSGSVTLYAYSTNGDTAYWYDAPTAGKLLTVNNKYTTPTLTTSTTYWVQTDAFRTRVGPYDNSATFTSGGNANTSSFGLTFDAPLQDIVIDSLTVYPYKTGYMQIDVVTSTGKRVATWHDTVYVGFTNDSVRIAPKLQVPKGTNYRIICDSSKTGGFWRSTAGMKYVYNAAKKNICKIKSNGSGSTSTYDVFYNLGVSTRLICPSQRVPVKAVIGSGAKPTASFTLGTSSTCTGTSVSISDKSTISSGTITSWYITFGDGNTYSSTSTGSTSHSYSTAGKFKVLLTVTGSGGCQDTISKYVTINTLPMVGFSANDVCLGTATNFTDTSKKVASGAVYSWDFGDGNSSAAINPSHTYATSGSFTVKLVIANGTCKDSITRTVKVNSTPKAKFGFSGAGCGGASISFVDSSTNAANYLWSFGDGNTSTASSPSHAYAVAGTYTVKLFTSNGTCYDSTSHTLTVAPNPVANFSYSGALCLNKVISFKDSSSISSGKITSYSWSFGDGNSDTAMNPTHSYTKSGTMTVVLSVTSDAGCTGKAAIKALAIDVDASPAFTFNNDSLRYYSFTATDTKAASYDWQFGDGGSSNAANPTHKYATNDTFKVTLTVTNSTGCIFTKTTKLSVFTGIVLTYNPVYEVNVAPNPFHDNATISYTLPTDANVDAGIYDMMGRKVATLVNTKQSSGSYQVVFTPESTQSSAGIYMLRLNVNGETITREIIRLR